MAKACIKIRFMKTIAPEQIQPEVHFANHILPEPGSAWGFRTIPDIEVILILDGTFELELGDAPPLTVGADEVLTLPPAIPHRLRHTDGTAELSCIHCELLEGLSYAAYDYRPAPPLQTLTRIRRDDPLKAVFLHCAEVFARPGRHRNALLQTCARELWLRLAACWQEAPSDGPLSERMSAMLAFLQKHLTESVGRRELARQFHLTPEHINFLFKTELGVSPTGYVLRERVRRAFLLLQEQDLTVQEAAYAVGFTDPFHFSRTFKRIYNLPPGHIRRFMKPLRSGS